MTAPTPCPDRNGGEGRSPDQGVGKNSKMSWQGETSYINKEMIQKYVGDLNLPIYYVSGPPKMVKAMRDLLEKIGVLKDNIRFEEFAGY